MADAPTSPQKRRRRWPWILGGVALLIVVLLALLPTFVTWGLGHGTIRKSIAQSINGDVQFARLKASWFGDQTVESLRIVHSNGDEAANLNVTVRAGLFQIITQQPGPVDVAVSGTLKGEVREDGSLSFGDLIAAKQPSQQQQPKPPSQPQPINVSNLPPLQVTISDVDVQINDARTQQTYLVQDLNGTLSYQEPTQPITFALNGTTTSSAGGTGSIAIDGLLDNAFSPGGLLSLKEASARVDAKVESFPIPVNLPGSDVPAHIQNAKFDLISDDLTQRIVASAELNAVIEGQPPAYANAQIAMSNVLTTTGDLSLSGGSVNITLLAQNLPIRTQEVQGQLNQLRATLVSNDLTKTVVAAIDSNAELHGHAPTVLAVSLSVDELFDADGRVKSINHIIEKTTGTIQGSTIPTALVQPLLANTPIDAARDLGPVVDLNASFSSGATRDVSIVMEGAMRVEARASIDTDSRAIRGHQLMVSAPYVHPDLVHALGGVSIDQPTDLTVRLTSFLIPPGDPLPMHQVAATGIIAVRGPVNVTLPGDNRPTLAVQNAQVHFDSPALGEHVRVDGAATVDDASVTFKQRLTNLFNSGGELDAANVLSEGTLAFNNVRAATVVKFAPDQQPLIEQVIGPAMSATIETFVQDSQMNANVQATGAAFDLRASMMRRPDALQVASANADLRITPKLAAALQKDAAEPIALSAPATLSVHVQPFDLPSKGGFAYALPADPINATVETQQFVIENPPALAEPLGIAYLISELALTMREQSMKLSATGDVEILRPANGQSVAHARYRSETFRQGESFAATATIGVTGLSMTNLEQLLGQPAGEISQWTGDSGDMNVHVELNDQSQKIILRPLLPYFHGEFTTTLDENWITINGETHEMKLARAAMESRMNPKTEAAASPSGGAASPRASVQRVQLLDDVPVSMKVKQIRLPRKMDAGFDPAQVVIDAEITGGPMRLASATETGDVRATLNDLRFTVNSKNLAEGVQFALKSSAQANVPEQPLPNAPPGTVSAPASQTSGEQQPQSGTLDMSGSIVDLVDEQSRLNLAGAKLRMNASAKNVPTAVADALANMQGLLTAAVGPVMTATLKAQNFSLESGRLENRIETPNGFLESTILGRENSLRVNTQNPLTAQLAITAPLRDRLLYKIHPIFADIRTTEQPLVATINWAQVGFKEDGTFDISDLNANIEITIGKVAFDSGSTTLFLLRLFGQEEKRATIPGEFEPIIARIRKGMVTYDRFAVRIDKYTMVYSGQINLVNQTMNLRTEVPLAALGQSIRELEPYADKIIVPIVTRGKFGEQKTMIDPEFDIGKEAIKAGFGGTLENLLRDRGGLGGLLDRLNRNRKE